MSGLSGLQQTVGALNTSVAQATHPSVGGNVGGGALGASAGASLGPNGVVININLTSNLLSKAEWQAIRAIENTAIYKEYQKVLQDVREIESIFLQLVSTVRNIENAISSLEKGISVVNLAVSF